MRGALLQTHLPAVVVALVMVILISNASTSFVRQEWHSNCQRPPGE